MSQFPATKDGRDRKANAAEISYHVGGCLSPATSYYAQALERHLLSIGCSNAHADCVDCVRDIVQFRSKARCLSLTESGARVFLASNRGECLNVGDLRIDRQGPRRRSHSTSPMHSMRHACWLVGCYLMGLDVAKDVWQFCRHHMLWSNYSGESCPLLGHFGQWPTNYNPDDSPDTAA